MKTKNVIGKVSEADNLGLRQNAEREGDHEVAFFTDEYGPLIKYRGMELRGDFSHMKPRLTLASLRGELLVKASGIKELLSAIKESGIDKEGEGREEQRRPVLLDATAGLGEDSLILAAAGFRVKLYEKDPVIGALLQDAIEKAKAYSGDLATIKEAAMRMELFREDSIVAMKEMAQGSVAPMQANGQVREENKQGPDVILLDPMFPEKKKKSLSKKKMQLLQLIEKPCEDEEALLEAALSLRPGRIIIKRPPKGPYLAGYKPTYSLTGKIVRIDCIVL